MYFKQLMIGGYDDNFSYLIGDDKTREVAVVDPDNLPMIERVVKEDGLKVVAILITHEHFDHISGIPEALKRWQVPIYAHPESLKKIGKIKADLIKLKDGSEIEIGSLIMMAFHAPGHAPSCMCYLAENKLIVGDVLFVGGCGRCDLPGSDVEAMWQTLSMLKKLPDHVEVYPGHDYGSTPFSTIGEEKKYNRFLACETYEAFYKKRMG